MGRQKFNAFRDGRVHVNAAMCATCIFRPGNLMHLDGGRRDGMVKEARKADSAIMCHDTLDGAAQAVCRGFFEQHKTAPLQVAERMGVIEWDKP